MAATSDATQPSTAVSVVVVSPNETQSFGFFASSFPKQPFVGSRPPVNLVRTLVSQPLASGSGGLPGLSASASHLRRPAAFLAMQLALLARTFAGWADGGALAGPSSVIPRPAAIERIVDRIIPPPLSRRFVDGGLDQAGFIPRQAAASPERTMRVCGNFRRQST